MRLRKSYKLSYNYPVLVTTDDREWTRDHLHHIDAHATLSSEGTLEDDFKTLVASKYVVISNSTFSLWAAMLNAGSGHVIAPAFWFHPHNKMANLLGSIRQNICPSDWKYQHPTTGEKIKHAYQHQQCPQERNYFRSIMMSNRWR
jgi:hypothetical protein